MDLLYTLVAALICGALARALLPGEHKMGWLATMLLGIVGAFAAFFAGSLLGLYRPGDSVGFIGSVIGAVGMLWVWEKYVARNPDYPKEVESKIKDMFDQFKGAAKDVASNVQDVVPKETPKEPPEAPAAANADAAVEAPPAPEQKENES